MSSSSEDADSIVVDIGNFEVKYGLCGDDEPKGMFLASESVDCPSAIYKGSLQNVDSIVQHVKTAIENLGEDAGTMNLLMGLPSTITYQEKEKITESVFENTKIPGFHIASSSCLAVYSTGRTTGLAVDIGHTQSNFTPVFEGFPLWLQPCHLTSPLCGEEIDNLLRKRNPALMDLSAADLKEVKSKHCKVFPTFGEACDAILEAESQDNLFTLPDGRDVKLGREVETVPEMLFSPHSYGIKSPGLHEMIYNSAVRIELELQDDMFRNIVVFGGTASIPGMKERIENELVGFCNTSVKVIMENGNGNTMAWQGGSILGSLTTFEGQWAFRVQYEEDGASTTVKRHFNY